MTRGSAEYASTPALIIVLLGTVLILGTAGCDGSHTAPPLEEAYQSWVVFAMTQPEGETADQRAERARTLMNDAERRLAGVHPGLRGDDAFFGGSLLQAAGKSPEAAPLLEAALEDLGGERANQARMAAAAARLATRDPDLARQHLMAVTDRDTYPTVTDTFNNLLFELVEIYEQDRRYSDALPLLELVRDSGNEQLAPVAARWIAYIHRDAGDEERAGAAARDAMKRFPDDENLNTRMVNFIHQHGLVGQPLPGLPALTWPDPAQQWKDPADLLEGKVGLIDLWAPWCPPCRKSFGFLKMLQRRHGDDGLQVVGLTRLYGYYEDEKTRIDNTLPEKELELIRAFAASHQLSWPVGVAAEGDALFATLGVAGIPNFIIVDRQGIVRGTFLGEAAPVKQQIEDLVMELLQQ